MTTEATHVHDCTGPGMTCPCGFKFTVPRYMVTVEVYDNDTKTSLVNEAFNCDHIGVAINALEDAIEEIR